MPKNLIIELIVAAVTLILSIQMYRGKWLFLIAGYNTMRKERKAQYNTSRLSKCLSIYLFLISVILFYSVIFPESHSNAITITMILLTVVLLVVGNSPFTKAKRD